MPKYNLIGAVMIAITVVIYAAGTTLGYGDITLTQNWLLLSGIETLSGIMLAAWTTAMLFAIVQRAWQGISQQNPGKFSPGASGAQQ